MKPNLPFLSLLAVLMLTGCDNASLHPDVAQARSLQRMEEIQRQQLEVEKRQAVALERIATALEQRPR
jgi:outer membrane biogenesis lipoprotein LolB